MYYLKGINAILLKNNKKKYIIFTFMQFLKFDYRQRKKFPQNVLYSNKCVKIDWNKMEFNIKKCDWGVLKDFYLNLI